MLSDALEHLVQGIVVYPDDVDISQKTNNRGNILEVRVHPDDLGRVIGRQGRTAKALRSVMNAVSQDPVRVNVIDVDKT